MAAALRRLSSRGAQSLFFFIERPAVLRRTMHTSVWWDLNDCKIPKGCDPSSFAGNITSALVEMKELLEKRGFLQQEHGTMSFSAYTNMDRIDPKVEQGLSGTGIRLTHVPYSRDRRVVGTKILGDLVKWTKAHPPPGNCLFIFDAMEFFYALDHLQEEGYEILLARPRDPDCSSNDLSAAKALWLSKSLLAGRPPLWIKTGENHDYRDPPYRYLYPSLCHDDEEPCY